MNCGQPTLGAALGEDGGGAAGCGHEGGRLPERLVQVAWQVDGRVKQRGRLRHEKTVVGATRWQAMSQQTSGVAARAWPAQSLGYGGCLAGHEPADQRGGGPPTAGTQRPCSSMGRRGCGQSWVPAEAHLRDLSVCKVGDDLGDELDDLRRGRQGGEQGRESCLATCPHFSSEPPTVTGPCPSAPA